MNKDFKNLGISFAISSILDGLSLQKMDFPFLDRYVYLIKSKDGKIDYVADLEKDSNNLDTDEVLRNILTYAKNNLSDDKKPLDFSNRKAESESIALVLNLLKSKANDIYKRWTKYADNEERKLSPEQKQLDELANALYNISEAFYNDCDPQSNEFDVVEYMLSTLDIVYGEGTLEPEVLGQPIDPEEIADKYKEFSEDINAMKEYDGMITNVLNINDQLTNELYDRIMGRDQDSDDADEDYYGEEGYDDDFESEDYDSDDNEDSQEIENLMPGIFVFFNNVFGEKNKNKKDQNKQSENNDDIQDEDDGKDDLTK